MYTPIYIYVYICIYTCTIHEPLRRNGYTKRIHETVKQNGQRLQLAQRFVGLKAQSPIRFVSLKRFFKCPVFTLLVLASLRIVSRRV